MPMKIQTLACISLSDVQKCHAFSLVCSMCPLMGNEPIKSRSKILDLTLTQDFHRKPLGQGLEISSEAGQLNCHFEVRVASSSDACENLK